MTLTGSDIRKIRMMQKIQKVQRQIPWPVIRTAIDHPRVKRAMKATRAVLFKTPDGTEYTIPKTIPLAVVQAYAADVVHDDDLATNNAAKALLSRKALQALDEDTRPVILGVIQGLMDWELEKVRDG